MSTNYQDLMHDLITNNPEDKDVPIAMGLAMVADAISNAASSLGLRDAATPMGAIEALSKEIRDGLGELASSINTER